VIPATRRWHAGLSLAGVCGDDYECVDEDWIWSDSHCVHPAPPPDEPHPPKGGNQQ
jgi:hypothetical protein